jgi:hypothetical protein
MDAVYDRSPTDIAIAIEMLLNHTHLTIQDADVVAAALDRFQSAIGARFFRLPAPGARAKGRSSAAGNVRADTGKDGRSGADWLKPRDFNIT